MDLPIEVLERNTILQWISAQEIHVKLLTSRTVKQ